MEKLSKHDGSDAEHFPLAVAVMQYIVKMGPNSRLGSAWKGHCITRRNLLHFRGQNLDANDVRWNEDGFRPLPNLEKECTAEEREYLMQNLETLLHGNGGVIVARLKECIEDGGEMDCPAERSALAIIELNIIQTPTMFSLFVLGSSLISTRVFLHLQHTRRNTLMQTYP